jgi:hypothetical protein
MDPRINKWLDLLDRAGWTAVQAACGALVAALATDAVDWQSALIMVGTATLVAVAKVVVGQRTGADEMGSLIGKPVIETPTGQK